MPTIELEDREIVLIKQALVAYETAVNSGEGDRDLQLKEELTELNVRLGELRRTDP
jgi:hypothetical protein